MTQNIKINRTKYDFKDDIDYIFKAKKGLSEKLVKDISSKKEEPDWMLDYRLKSLAAFLSKPLPSWGADLTKIDFKNFALKNSWPRGPIRWRPRLGMHSSRTE